MRAGWLLLLFLLAPLASAQTIGAYEEIIIYGEDGPRTVLAKIDTGADSSSIDEELARELGLQEIPGETRTVEGALGRAERPVAQVTFTLADRTETSKFSLAQREQLEVPVLIGKGDMQGFIVNPALSETTTPEEASVLQRIIGTEELTFIILIPILSSLIIILRILIGVQTYGVFGPLVIALSMIEATITSQLMLYLLLLVAGALFTIFIKRLRMPMLCEISLLLFFLAALTITAANFLVITIFPLIITSFLIERFSQDIEVRRTKHAIGMLATTLITAVVLAYVGTWLSALAPAALLLAALLAISIVLGLAHYVGLRLTELIRFQFVERKG